jgi:hypothetical protein
LPGAGHASGHAAHRAGRALWRQCDPHEGTHRRLLASAGGTHQPLGEIIDIYGDTVETTTCAFERGWIGSIRRPFMPLYPGDQVIELVETVSGAG